MSRLTPVMLKTYEPGASNRLADLNYAEIMRYGGMMTSRTPVPPGDTAGAEEEMRALIDECASEVLPLLSYRVSCRYTDVGWNDGALIMPFDTHGSKNLAHTLEGCTEAVMFAATIGVGIDRLITKYNHISPSKALIMQALGAERVEALCDTFNEEIAAEASGRGLKAKPRFSPGYGDLPLTVQKEFMTLLDCAHLIGINLNESMLMSPSKSVTAVIGLY